jgi:hypothetical protein
VRLPDAATLTPKELTWLANQQRKQAGQSSKYVRHQGAREKARRLRQMARDGQQVPPGARYAGAVVTAFGARAHATGSRQKKEHNDRRPASEREYY